MFFFILVILMLKRLAAHSITNVFGLITSFIFALLVVILTGWFEKKGFKLKL